MSDGGDTAPEDDHSNRFFQLLKNISAAGSMAGGAALIAITLIVSYDVIARFVGSPTLWANEIAGYLLIAVAVLGAGSTLHRNEHFAMTLLVDALPARARLWTSLIVWSAVLALVCGLVIGLADLAISSLNFGLRSYTILRFPLAIPQIVLFVGFVILAGALLARVVGIVRRLGRRTE